MLLDLTIAIPVRNEEKNLHKCLSAIGKDFARKIVVIDSMSTDNTKTIATDFHAEILDFNWDGKFPKKRNWFLQKHTPATKWILFLDADEYISENFKNEVQKVLSNSDNDGYWLNYCVYFMGKKLKGGYPLKKLALFRVGAGYYERIEEEKWSKLDMEIHEHPIIEGKTGEIKTKIDHQDFRGTGHYISKHNEYADWEAERFISSLNSTKDNPKWTFKQKIKYKLMNSFWIGPLFFIGSFLLLRGYRDGKRGLAFAILKMNYFNQIYCKICEHKIFLKEKNKVSQNSSKHPQLP